MSTRVPLYLALAFVLCAATPPAPTPQSGEETVDISAEQSLEWHEDTRLYVARGKAKAINGTLTIEADLMTAHRREDAGKEPAKKAAPSDGMGQGSIDTLTAEGQVRIQDGQQQAFGQKATYDVDTGIVMLTGEGLKYVTPTETVTARDSLEYHQKRNVALARGKAMGVQKDMRVEADTLTATFTKEANGRNALKELRAEKNVTIVSQNGDVSRGELAVYDPQKDKAILSGGVRLTQGQTQLAGDRAEVDFKTGQSRLLNDGSGRVRALLSTKKAPADTKSKP